MRTRMTALALALPTTALLVGTVLAGGWATATLDPGTPGPQAGTPTTIGFQVLQHGITPNSSLTVVVHGANATGGSISANATAQGPVGHYVATLTFPTHGAWTITWTSELDMTASSTSLAVSAAAPVAPASNPTSVATPAPFDTLALLVVGLVLIGAISGGAVVLRRRRGRASIPSVG